MIRDSPLLGKVISPPCGKILKIKREVYHPNVDSPPLNQIHPSCLPFFYCDFFHSSVHFMAIGIGLTPLGASKGCHFQL